MLKPILDDHPLRIEMANELHARPFPELDAPCSAAFIAIKEPENAAGRDRGRDVAHLVALLDRYGAPHPAPGAGHHSAVLGRFTLKWEMHTEFVTYTIFADGMADDPFHGTIMEVFPQQWLADSPGKIATSALVRVEVISSDADLQKKLKGPLEDWFVEESLAVSQVMDGEAVIAGDFRIDTSGHIRFAVLARKGIGSRRLGRVVQRMLEIETYKSMAMLTLPVARRVAVRVAQLDAELAGIVQGMADRRGADVETLEKLLQMAAEIEALSSSSDFRFGAAGAYEAIVMQRIGVLREERIGGRPLFAEFMTRRFDPAMRTCRSAQDRLSQLSARAERAANLLRTRVDVATSEQNHEVLKRMDHRAALQLRLQKTVEGLSVVAISYYAVSLAGIVLAPLGARLDLGRETVEALVAAPVLILVWMMIRRIRSRI